MPEHDSEHPKKSEKKLSSNWFKKHKVMTGILAFIALCVIINALSPSSKDNLQNTSAKSSDSGNTSSATSPTTSNSGTSTKSTTSPSTQPASTNSTSTNATSIATPPPSTPAVTVSQKNAVNKAKDYLNVEAFSHDGLIDQLEYDQFSAADATYAADNSGADWNQQAAKKAKEYMDTESFSRQGLIDQLVYDKFTTDQATFGVNSVGL